MNKNIPGPAVLLASLRIPTALLTISDFIKQYNIMTPRNLCNSLLHKFRGDTIPFSWISFPHQKNAYGMLKKLLKTVGLGMF